MYNIFKDYPSIRLADVELKIKKSFIKSHSELNYKRDYNSSSTIKLYLSLDSECKDFIEYFPNTALKSTSIPHINPQLLAGGMLPKRITKHGSIEYGGNLKISSKF